MNEDEMTTLIGDEKKSRCCSARRLAIAGCVLTVAGVAVVGTGFILLGQESDGLVRDPVVRANTTLIYNGNFITMDPDMPMVEAIVFDGNGTITDRGTTEAMLIDYGPLNSTDVRFLDANGRTVIPGIIDAHGHLVRVGLQAQQAQLRGLTSVEDTVASAQTWATANPAAEWIEGFGWNENRWDPIRRPNITDLDTAFPDRPVYLTRIDAHAVWVNSAAIELAGDAIPVTGDIPGGTIERDENGDPTGIFTDTAMKLFPVPPPSVAQVQAAITFAANEVAREGITSMHNAGTSDYELEIMRDMVTADPSFPLRVYAMLDGGDLDNQDKYCANFPDNPQTYRLNGRLTASSVKLVQDGALGSRGAALLEEYSDAAGEFGQSRYTNEELTALTLLWMSCNYQVNTHAIGDAANRDALDAFEAASEAFPGEDLRMRVEHAQVLTAQDLPRFAELDVIASMQPTHATSDYSFAEDRLGARVGLSYAVKDIMDTGARVALGSDFPVERINPFEGIYAAVSRQDRSGQPAGGWFPDQKLTREEALRGFTLDAAYAAFDEDRLGSLEIGKQADFVFIDRNIMDPDAVSEEEILDTSVLATVVGGECSYLGSNNAALDDYCTANDPRLTVPVCPDGVSEQCWRQTVDNGLTFSLQQVTSQRYPCQNGDRSATTFEITPAADINLGDVFPTCRNRVQGFGGATERVNFCAETNIAPNGFNFPCPLEAGEALRVAGTAQDCSTGLGAYTVTITCYFDNGAGGEGDVLAEIVTYLRY